MKNLLSRKFYFFVVLFCISNNIYSSDTKQLITTLTVIDDDSTFHYQYIYDKLGNILLETKYYDQDGGWVRKTQTEKSYTGNNCNNHWERIWNNGWITTFSINYTYLNGALVTENQFTYTNGVANPIIKVDYQYSANLLKTKSINNWMNGQWTLSQLENYSYFPTSKADSVTTITYQSGSILNQYLSIFTYNSDGNVSSQLIKQKEAEENWINTDSINWYYYPNTKMLESQRNKIWVSENSSWEYTQKIDYSYNSDKTLSTETLLSWKTMFWQNEAHYDYVYDDKGLELNKILSLPIYNKWQGIISIDYSNFIDNTSNLMESKYLFWGGNTGELTTSYIPFLFNDQMTIRKGKSLQISNIPLLDTGILELVDTEFQLHIPVYPNPSNGMYYFKAQEFGVQSWTISDLNGQLLKKQLQPENFNVIDITDLPNGVYLFRAKTPTKNYFEKLIKK